MSTCLAKVFSGELEGISAHCVEVEIDLHVGLHSFQIVGLADKALSEARERVSAALKNVGAKPPTKENRRIVVNLAPADVQKNGSQYDLAIAVGYLCATNQLRPFDTRSMLFLGELALDGSLRPVAGALNYATMGRARGLTTIILPAENAPEAALLPGVTVIPARHLREVIDHLEARARIQPQPRTPTDEEHGDAMSVTFDDIKGQAAAKRALTIAAAGGHNILLQGPPGSGKTMLAEAMTAILPPLTLEERIEVTKIYSAAGLTNDRPMLNRRPFRAPHHSASPVAITGGGSSPRPGEMSLAHHGVLFLDEVPEFRRDLLESLRQPLEQGRITVSRAKQTMVFPAAFMLVAAMNPCPCGHYGDRHHECRCTAFEVLRYQKKISGPLLDRIDMHITVPRPPLHAITQPASSRSETDMVCAQVAAARQRQHDRLGNSRSSVSMTTRECDQLIQCTPAARAYMDHITARASLSARGYYRLLKTAHTIADLEASAMVTEDHLAEAFGYRLRSEEFL